MKTNSDLKDKETVAGFDILFPNVGEVVGGSEREDNYQKIIENCQLKKIETKDLQ